MFKAVSVRMVSLFSEAQPFIHWRLREESGFRKLSEKVSLKDKTDPFKFKDFLTFRRADFIFTLEIACWCVWTGASVSTCCPGFVSHFLHFVPLFLQHTFDGSP